MWCQFGQFLFKAPSSLAYHLPPQLSKHSYLQVYKLSYWCDVMWFLWMPQGEVGLKTHYHPHGRRVGLGTEEAFEEHEDLPPSHFFLPRSSHVMSCQANRDLAVIRPMRCPWRQGGKAWEAEMALVVVQKEKSKHFTLGSIEAPQVM